MIYEKTMPDPVFKVSCMLNFEPKVSHQFQQLVMLMTNMDVSNPSLSDIDDVGSHQGMSEDETSPTRRGPPSEASSQEWDKLTDPGTQTPATT